MNNKFCEVSKEGRRGGRLYLIRERRDDSFQVGDAAGATAATCPTAATAAHRVSAELLQLRRRHLELLEELLSDKRELQVALERLDAYERPRGQSCTGV